MRADLAAAHPWLPAEVYRLLRDSKSAAGPPAAAPDPIPFGATANWKALHIIAFFAFQQGLVSRRYTADDFFRRDDMGVSTRKAKA